MAGTGASLARSTTKRTRLTLHEHRRGGFRLLQGAPLEDRQFHRAFCTRVSLGRWVAGDGVRFRLRAWTAPRNAFPRQIPHSSSAQSSDGDALTGEAVRGRQEHFPIPPLSRAGETARTGRAPLRFNFADQPASSSDSGPLQSRTTIPARRDTKMAGEEPVVVSLRCSSDGNAHLTASAACPA